MKNKKIKIFVIIILLIIIGISIGVFVSQTNKNQLKTIRSEKQLEKIYNGDTQDGMNFGKFLLTMPFSLFENIGRGISTSVQYDAAIEDIGSIKFNNADSVSPTTLTGMAESYKSTDGEIGSISSNKQYSTTNIQVENVDEADITKTDGNFIYSMSGEKVIITDVRDSNNLKIASEIELKEDTVPEELLLYQDKLVVISTKTTNRYTYNNDTFVSIYNIQDRQNPKLLKSYCMYEPYYTTRCINNRLYVISSGNLRKENNKIVTYYKEDYEQKQIGLENIKYLDKVKTKKQTLISMVDLDDVSKSVKMNSYLIDIDNAYISEKNIYLLEEDYKYSDDIKFSQLFGLKGIFGLFEDDYYNYDDYGTYTQIYKFNLLEDGQIKYDNSNKIKGETINQFSIDEYQNNLRIAIYDNRQGSKVVVFNEKLDVIGETPYLAKGEKMYSSRFMGNKAYLVTYQTIDPLFVIDLSDSTNPKVLGELKIPGYSTYLHPYDENHLIGIGMETQETVNRDSSGKVINRTAKITGMKMALFDVSDVTNPKQISSTIIGDSRATSAILTNHKALLFSKEKELIAIPVNNYAEDFEISTNSENVQTVTNSYKNYSKQYVSEGYWVYNINLNEGLKLKGIITHNASTRKYAYYNNSRLLRGIWIENELFTVSEDTIKVNKLNDLSQVSEISIRNKGN